MRDLVIDMMKERGVTIEDVSQIVLDLQRSYNPGLTIEQCRDSVVNVLDKREVQHCIITGITLDTYAEKKLLPEPLQTLMVQDNPLYGADEILAVGITNVYGTIGLTNFGYLDKVKPGIIARLNSKDGLMVHTFLDDIVAALAAAASARLAHNRKD